MKATINTLCVVCLLTLLGAPLVGHSQPLPQTVGKAAYAFNLPAQPLADSLRGLGAATGINVIFDPADVKGDTAPELSGHYAIRQALKLLLAGTHLTAEFTGASTIVIKPERKVTRPADGRQTAKVSLGKVLRTLDEIKVIGHVSALTATRSETPLRETPQTVSVISRETLDQQNATDLASALKYEPGITLEQHNSQQSYIFSRGFQVSSIHIDGSAPVQVVTGTINAVGISSRDMAEYDNIEVLRGSDALFGGMGNPGASVSMNRKEPTDYFQQKYTASIGSWDNYRVVGDVSGPLSSKWSARAVVSGSTGHYYYDIAHKHGGMFYGVMKYKFNRAADVSFGASYQTSSGVNNYEGLPLYDTGADPQLPRSLSLVAPWATVKTTFEEAFAKFNYTFARNWKLHVGTTYLKENMPNEITTSYTGPISSTTGLLKSPLNSIADTMANTQKMVDLTLTGSFNWLGHKQRVMLGGDYEISNYFADMREPHASTAPLIDPFNYDPALYPMPDYSQDNLKEELIWNSKTTQWGLYGAFRFVPIDHLAITLGGRQSSYRSQTMDSSAFYDFGFTEPAKPGGFVIKQKFTPYAGITYDLGKHYTAYASFADIYHENGLVFTEAGDRVPPANGNNSEVGLKGAWHHNTLNASLAFFKVNQQGIAVLEKYSYTRTHCCYSTADVRAKGVELNLTGTVTPHWQISAGLTVEKHQTKSSSFVRQRPLDMLKLWTNYVLPGEKWSVGGGVIFQSRNWSMECLHYHSGCQEWAEFGQGAHTVYALRAAYAIDDHWTAALNINNLFDLDYYSRISSRSAGNWYGDPRNFMLKIIGRY